MKKQNYYVTDRKFPFYSAPGKHEGPDLRVLKLESTESDPDERDEIVAALVGKDIYLDINVGDKVQDTLQFKPNLIACYTHYHATIVEIEKISKIKRTW